MKNCYQLISLATSLAPKFKFYYLFPILFLFSINGFSQTAGCNTPAEVLTINGACDGPTVITDGTENAPLINASTCAAGNVRREGWYSFDVTGGPLDVVITASSTNTNRDLFIQLISSVTNDCNNRVELDCANATNGNGAQTESITRNLADGTYFIKLANVGQNGDMNISSICLTTLCNTPNVTAATSIASTSAVINWTAATPAPANGYEYIVSPDNSTATPAGDFTGTSASTNANITGLTALTQYWVFVRSDCGSGNYSAWDGPITFTTTNGPVNDEPCGAIVLSTDLTCSTTQGTLVGATASTTTPSPNCGAYSGNEIDVWFTAQVAANGTMQIDALLDGGITDPVIAVYSAPSCAGPFTLLDCDDDAGVGLESLIQLSGLTPGDWLYIRVWRYINFQPQNTFDICVTEDDPYCDVASNFTTDYIEDFSTTGGSTNISNLNSGFSTGGWGDFTSMIVTQTQSGTVNFVVDFSNLIDDYGFNIWVDWNDDLDFLDAGENVYSSGGFITGVASSFNVPVTAPIGNHRMRIRSDFLSSNPSSCGTISFGEAEDYTLTVTPILCADNPTAITISAITTSSATISWTAPAPAPAGGYQYYVSTNPTPPNFNDPPTGTTAAGVTTANVSGLMDGTTYYVWVRSNCAGGNGLGAWQGPQNFDTLLAPPVAIDNTICQGDTGFIGATAACSGGAALGNTIDGNLDAANDPTALQPCIFIVSTDPCCHSGTNVSNYTSIDFEVTVTGTYSFAIDSSVTDDLMGWIVEGSWTPGTCVNTGTWIAGDDDSGPFLDPLVQATLVAGVTYTLFTTPYGNNTATLPYTWNVAGPGSLIESLPNGGLDWYNAASGGTLLGSGSPFIPVGMAGGLTDTNTAGTYTFWAECSANPGVRTPVDLNITQGPGGTISGTSLSCSVYEVTVDLLGSGPWTIKYTDGTNTTTVSTINSTPYTFIAPGAPGTTYSLTLVADTSGCNSIPADVTGSATVPPPGSGGLVWNGSSGTDWNTPGNWTPSGPPGSGDCVTIPDMAGGNDPIISGATDADCLSLLVEFGGVLTAQPGGTITVQDIVTVEPGGLFELEGLQQNTAQLIQVNDVNNSGNIVLTRDTNVRSQDYVYWSSPVENYSLTNIPSNFRFEWIPTIGGNPGQHGDWSAYSGIMNEGQGYIVRGPNGNGNNNNTATWNSIIFTGVPHNGNVSVPISRGTFTGPTILNGPGVEDNITAEEDNWNLVGNPYPSTLDADEFINDNGDLDGTVYLWTHGTRIQNGAGSPFYGNYSYNYNQADYLEYNLSGSTPAGFLGGIGSGQGFFVQMLHSASTPSTVLFENDQRDRTLNDQFFRNTSNNSNPADLERHRIWLDLVTPSGNGNAMLIAYVEGATFENDRRFDAKIIGGAGKNLYSLINNDESNYIIQGRPTPFDMNDQVRLGMVIEEIGQHGIAINTLDGIFDETNQGIYIEDLELGIIHDLRVSPYLFTTNETGTFDNRFVLRYTNESLGVDEFNSNSIIVSAPNNEYIKITSGNDTIESVTVYDILGRVLINDLNINSFEHNLYNVSQSDGTLFVKVILSNGHQKIKKVVIKQ